MPLVFDANYEEIIGWNSGQTLSESYPIEALKMAQNESKTSARQGRTSLQPLSPTHRETAHECRGGIPHEQIWRGRGKLDLLRTSLQDGSKERTMGVYH